MTWQRATLGEVALSIRNGLFARRPTDNQDGSRILRISAVRSGRVKLEDSRFVEDLEAAQIEKFSIKAGDLLVTRYNGSRALVGISGIVPTHDGAVIHPDKLIRIVLDTTRADPRFVNYQLQSPTVRSHLEPRIRTTAGQSGIAGADVRSIPLVLPPLDEQRRIVALLERHLSELDAAKRDLERGCAKHELVWLSMLSRLRRELLDERQARIGDIAESTLGKMLDAKRQTGTPTRYLRNINVRWGSFDLSDVQLTPLTETDLARFDVRAGDVMVCEGGEPGRCAVWQESGDGIAFQKALHRIRVHSMSEVVPEFLALMLTEAIRSGRSDHLFTGTTIKHLPQEKLRAVSIAIPGIDRQHAALAQVQNLATARARSEAAIDQAVCKGSTLRRSLLAAAFSGRLTRSDADLTEMAGA